jgi:uncharacterized protein DUF2271
VAATFPAKLSLGAIALTFACSSVSDGDPSYWEESRDLGGKHFPGFGQPGGADGAGGDGVGAAGGSGPGGNGGSGGSVGGNGGVGPGGSGPGGSGPGGDSGSGPGGNGGTDVGGNGGTGAVGGDSGSGGAGPGGTGGGGAGGTGPSTECNLTLNFTTATYRGQFSPKYINAVWVMNSQNQFMKTLEVYAAARIIHLTNWNAQARANKVDAVSGATIRHDDTRYNPHTKSHWDCRDVSGNIVPNGEYKVFMELTEDDSAFSFGLRPSKLFSFSFQKGAGPQTVTPPDQPTFKSITLNIQ